MGKYSALGDYLRQQSADEIPMTFDKVEAVAGVKLPASARQYRAWWSNNPYNSVMTKVWLEAGFESRHVDVEGRSLVFRRTRPVSAADVGKEEVKPLADRHPLIGALKGLLHVTPGVDLTVPADPDWGDRAWSK